jgi:hypothetical protein
VFHATKVKILRATCNSAFWVQFEPVAKKERSAGVPPAAVRIDK